VAGPASYERTAEDTAFVEGRDLLKAKLRLVDWPVCHMKDQRRHCLRWPPYNVTQTVTCPSLSNA